MAFGETGHMIPVIRLTAALENADHEVLAFCTNGYAEEKAQRHIQHYGVNAKLICPEHNSKIAVCNGVTDGVPN